jgi:2-polyprenyl-3-methyl-5-hydroxy-6-metoxy-1,4-benzoquinol methylase
MSKNEVLALEEFTNYRIHSYALKIIQNYQTQNRLESGEIRILDFGCGRGRSVLKLRLAGYDAYGADVDMSPIKNAGQLYQHYGFAIDKCLFKIDDKCSIPFDDNYFDIIFSEQVIEHVRNIDLFFKEISRLTKPEGITFHTFPYKYHFIEQHLYMPLIHWLPKNRLRKFAIFFWLCVGKEPFWKELDGSSISQKVERYYTYSINKTYYRSNDFFQNFLKGVGFTASLKNLRSKFNFRILDSYFPHSTRIVATKVKKSLGNEHR